MLLLFNLRDFINLYATVDFSTSVNQKLFFGTFAILLKDL